MFDDFDLYETCEEYYNEEEWIDGSEIEQGFDSFIIYFVRQGFQGWTRSQ